MFDKAKFGNAVAAGFVNGVVFAISYLVAESISRKMRKPFTREQQDILDVLSIRISNIEMKSAA